MKNDLKLQVFLFQIDSIYIYIAFTIERKQTVFEFDIKRESDIRFEDRGGGILYSTTGIYVAQLECTCI